MGREPDSYGLESSGCRTSRSANLLRSLHSRHWPEKPTGLATASGDFLRRSHTRPEPVANTEHCRFRRMRHSHLRWESARFRCHRSRHSRSRGPTSLELHPHSRRIHLPSALPRRRVVESPANHHRCRRQTCRSHTSRRRSDDRIFAWTSSGRDDARIHKPVLARSRRIRLGIHICHICRDGICRTTC